MQARGHWVSAGWYVKCGSHSGWYTRGLPGKCAGRLSALEKMNIHRRWWSCMRHMCYSSSNLTENSKEPPLMSVFRKKLKQSDNTSRRRWWIQKEGQLSGESWWGAEEIQLDQARAMFTTTLSHGWFAPDWFSSTTLACSTSTPQSSTRIEWITLIELSIYSTKIRLLDDMISYMQNCLSIAPLMSLPLLQDFLYACIAICTLHMQYCLSIAPPASWAPSVTDTICHSQLRL